MSSPSSKQILRLYKDLLRYGQQMKYTDRQYFFNWIREEFKDKKTLTNSEDIEYSFKKGLEVLKHKRIV